MLESTNPAFGVATQVVVLPSVTGLVHEIVPLPDATVVLTATAPTTKVAVTVHAALIAPVVYGLVVPATPPQPLTEPMTKPMLGVSVQVVVLPIATGLVHDIVPPMPLTVPVTTKVNTLTPVVAFAELLPDTASVVAALTLAVAETVPLKVEATATTSVKVDDVTLKLALLQLITPAAPTEG
jgi:hypothetical protein